MSVLLSLCLDEAAKPEQNNESLSVPLYQEIKNLILNSSLTIKFGQFSITRNRPVVLNYGIHQTMAGFQRITTDFPFFLLVHKENCTSTRNKYKLIKSVVVS